MKEQYAALVVGAGIGGIRSALDLAQAGYKVALIDKSPNMGGLLCQLDRQFPSDHCGMCKLLPMTDRDLCSQFCMRKGIFHENLDIFLSSELTGMEGEPGKFQVSVRKKSSFVDQSKCTSCGICAEVCPVRVPSEFNAGLTERSAVYLPVPHNIPNQYVVDLEACTRCWECFHKCPTKAIDFKFAQRKEFNLIIYDQDESTAQNLEKWLQKYDFELKKAKDRDELDLLLQEAGNRPGLIFLHMSMQDQEMKKLLQRTWELASEMEIVLLAEKGHEDQVDYYLSKGVLEVLFKPLKSEIVPWLDKQFMRIAGRQDLTFQVGALILAPGFSCYDPGAKEDLFGYGQYPGVVTSLEFERIISGTGPSSGQLKRPDGHEIRKIAWIQCVGSRDIQNADYCSSFCCMASIKEALLAKELSSGQVATTIFYMDMRTFGRDFQRYKDKAQNEQQVRFVPCRIHSVLPAADDAHSLQLAYLDAEGKLQNEEFDLLVLAVGARPLKGLNDLAAVTGIETNKHGFCKTQHFSPSRTTQLGVFASGSFARPMDIGESIMQASAAAMEAGRQVSIYAIPRAKQEEKLPMYSDVSRQAPRTLIVLCTACPTLEELVDIKSLRQDLSQLPGVCQVECISQACTAEGWQEIGQVAQKCTPNRILIGACMPYAYLPRINQLGAALSLDPAFIQVVDIYTSTFSQVVDKEVMKEQILTSLSMAVAELQGAEPSSKRAVRDVSETALVVGGGLAGMTAAMAMADQGFKVCLVEKSDKLGGIALNIHYTLEGQDAQKYMQDLIEDVQKHPLIHVCTRSRISLSSGSVGKFQTIISSDEDALTLEHGVSVLASGGAEFKPYNYYGYGAKKTVLTQSELEEQIATAKLDANKLESLTMIQCVGFREEPRNYCSRICCYAALKNALKLKKRNPDLQIYIFYRDIMSYGFTESYFTQARKLGIIFIRYDLEHKPEVSFKEERPVIYGLDPVMNRNIRIDSDILVLSTGIVPNKADELSEIFGVSLNQDGFFQEAESKWRPVEFLKQGIYFCGLAHSPRNMPETIISAKAAAQSALRILARRQIKGSKITTEVKHTLCALCGRCVQVCPYDARYIDTDQEKVIVDSMLCQGCGSCAAVCPNSATILKEFQDGQIMSEIDAALGCV